jgi:hypothetical protein
MLAGSTVREAKRVLGIWNARHAANHDLWFHPTIGAAITRDGRGCASIARPVGRLVRLTCARLIAIAEQRLKV